MLTFSNDKIFYEWKRVKEHVDSPAKSKQKGRKHGLKEENPCEVRKRLRLEGQEYTSATGKIIPAAKKMKYMRCKCIHKCADNISTESRQIAYDNYWKISNREQRKQFLLDRINNHHPKRRRLDGDVKKAI